MSDRELSAGCVIAFGLWVLVVVLLTIAWMEDDGAIGQAGLATSAAAATATIRQYFVVQNQLIVQNSRRREGWAGGVTQLGERR